MSEQDQKALRMYGKIPAKNLLKLQRVGLSHAQPGTLLSRLGDSK
jgi:hypothetical protein